MSLHVHFGVLIINQFALSELRKVDPLRNLNVSPSVPGFTLVELILDFLLVCFSYLDLSIILCTVLSCWIGCKCLRIRRIRWFGNIWLSIHSVCFFYHVFICPKLPLPNPVHFLYTMLELSTEPITAWSRLAIDYLKSASFPESYSASRNAIYCY